jgi:hypothetical protein
LSSSSGEQNEIDSRTRSPSRAKIVLVGCQRPISDDHEGVVAARRAVDARGVTAQPRLELAVVKARRDRQVERHLPTYGLDDPQQLRARRARIVDGKAVHEACFAAAARKAGLEHERPVEVVAARPDVLLRRSDRAVAAAFPPDDPPEAAAVVDPGHATPVDRARTRDERGGAAVADQRVVTDRRVALGPGHRGSALEQSKAGQRCPGRAGQP